MPMILQSEAAECGLACLVMIARYHGHEVDLPSLRRRFSTSLKGASLAQIIHIAQALNFEARPLRAELSHLAHLKAPCIIHWNLNHFVVLKRVGRDTIEVLDPARGVCRMPVGEFSKHFTGVALELRPGSDFSPIKEVKRITLRALTGHISGLKRVLFQVFGLALAIELLGLSIPFQMQWVLDQVLVSADTSLLLVVGLAFAIIIIAQTGLTLARAWVISWLGASLSAQWVTNLFSHLLKLPLDFFEKRHMGDIVSRFSSVHSIQQTLTGSFVESMLDGLMGSLALAVLLFYSIKLTAVVLVASLIYLSLRWLIYQKLWQVNEEQLIYAARQQSELMESVRGVQAIKLANKQGGRVVRLTNITMEAAERNMQSQRIGLAFNAINHGLFGIQRVLLLSLGAWMVMSGALTIGMLVAFLAFSDQFTTRIGSVVDKWVEFRMLQLHAERISDIALAEPEKIGLNTGADSRTEFRLEIRNLSFRYSDNDPWVLRDVNLAVEPHESVAIVGPSGCGKSTLAKIILGLLKPTEGVVEIDGIDINKYGLNNYRELVSAVMQDDQLFAGSIADNIAFFDEGATLDRITAAAKVAAIHQDVLAMPMGYESLVGDMGSTLSGGQKQRVMFARAVYRNPRILVLDEATSHLDMKCEELINHAVKKFEATRIVIAHRAETISSADRIIRLTSGIDVSAKVA